MPPELASICIKAGSSEKGSCPACRAPWVRRVERTAMVIDRSERTHALGYTRTSGTMLAPPESHTVGWRPSCACPTADPVPCLIFDPFVGAGTTPLVAARLGRIGIGTDLNREYLAMASERIRSGLRPLSRLDPAKPVKPMDGQGLLFRNEG